MYINGKVFVLFAEQNAFASIYKFIYLDRRNFVLRTLKR